MVGRIGEEGDDFIAFSWQGREGEALLVVVKYAPNQAQCYVKLPLDDLRGNKIRLSDRLSSAVFDRDGDALVSQGLYMDEPVWRSYVFEITRI